MILISIFGAVIVGLIASAIGVGVVTGCNILSIGIAETEALALLCALKMPKFE